MIWIEGSVLPVNQALQLITASQVTLCAKDLKSKHHVTLCAKDLKSRHHVILGAKDLKSRHHVTLCAKDLKSRHHVFIASYSIAVKQKAVEFQPKPSSSSETK